MHPKNRNILQHFPVSCWFAMATVQGRFNIFFYIGGLYQNFCKLLMTGIILKSSNISTSFVAVVYTTRVYIAAIASRNRSKPGLGEI